MANPTNTKLFPQRTVAYRYGFNGKEKDNETYGEGNEYDYGARIYDPRISKWFSVDSKSRDYSGFSPYSFSVNNPIYFIDPDGKRVFPADEKTKAVIQNHLTNKFGPEISKLLIDRMIFLMDPSKSYRPDLWTKDEQKAYEKATKELNKAIKKISSADVQLEANSYVNSFSDLTSTNYVKVITETVGITQDRAKDNASIIGVQTLKYGRSGIQADFKMQQYMDILYDKNSDGQLDEKTEGVRVPTFSQGYDQNKNVIASQLIIPTSRDGSVSNENTSQVQENIGSAINGTSPSPEKVDPNKFLGSDK